MKINESFIFPAPPICSEIRSCVKVEVVVLCVDVKQHLMMMGRPVRAWGLCESRSGRPGLPVNSLYVDVKQHRIHLSLSFGPIVPCTSAWQVQVSYRSRRVVLATVINTHTHTMTHTQAV